jgi:hypothetical protein
MTDNAMTDIDSSNRGCSSNRNGLSERTPHRASNALVASSSNPSTPAATAESPAIVAASHTEGTADERVTCLRIYADSRGETHMQDIDIALSFRALFKDHPPLRLSDTLAASGCNICRVPSGMREVGWHNPPRRELVIWLTGDVEFETSDGNVRRLGAGSAVFAEDTTGKGHISRHPPEGQLVIHIDLL